MPKSLAESVYTIIFRDFWLLEQNGQAVYEVNTTIDVKEQEHVFAIDVLIVCNNVDARKMLSAAIQVYFLLVMLQVGQEVLLGQLKIFKCFPQNQEQKTSSIIESGSFWLKCGSKTNIVWFVFPVFL